MPERNDPTRPTDTEVAQEHDYDQSCHGVPEIKKSRILFCAKFRRPFTTKGGLPSDLSIWALKASVSKSMALSD